MPSLPVTWTPSLRVVTPAKRDAGVHDVLLDAVEAPEEIEMPPRAAELAVGDRLQADVLLLLDDALDLAVFDRLQRRRRDLALGALRARLMERGGTQQAADMVGAERRFWFHVVSSLSVPTPPRRSRRSCGASPIAPLRRARCPPRSRQSRIAATGRADRAGTNFAASSMRRLISSLDSSVPVFEVTRPSTTMLALRHEAQRLEAAGALAVVLHEIAVHVDGVEQQSPPPARSRRWR